MRIETHRGNFASAIAIIGIMRESSLVSAIKMDCESMEIVGQGYHHADIDMVVKKGDTVFFSGDTLHGFTAEETKFIHDNSTYSMSDGLRSPSKEVAAAGRSAGEQWEREIAQHKARHDEAIKGIQKVYTPTINLQPGDTYTADNGNSVVNHTRIVQQVPVHLQEDDGEIEPLYPQKVEIIRPTSLEVNYGDIFITDRGALAWLLNPINNLYKIDNKASIVELEKIWLAFKNEFAKDDVDA